MALFKNKQDLAKSAFVEAKEIIGEDIQDKGRQVAKINSQIDSLVTQKLVILTDMKLSEKLAKEFEKVVFEN